jgi:uncharacterized protein YndB with AHSA1/START domain
MKNEKSIQMLHFSIEIDALKEKVWHTMLDDKTYRTWTAAFMEGSYYKGDWKKGSKIQFLAPSGDGMISKIAESTPFDFISIEHLGCISNGEEDFESEEAKATAGAHENYTFKEKDGITTLEIDVDTDEKYKSMFEEIWPKALSKLKELVEK